MSIKAQDKPSGMEEPVQDVAPFKPRGRFWLAFISLSIVNLSCALDATIVAVDLPVISAALHGSSIQAIWIGTSFLLASTVWQPLFIAFSDVWGRRPLMLLGLALFLSGTILGGLSWNMTIMLVGRSLQGAGAGGVMGLTDTLITDLVPLRERGNFFSLISIVWALGTVAGPLVGGALGKAGLWRWIFWLNVPILVIGSVGIGLFLTLNLKERTFDTKLREIDYLGSFIFVSSLSSFLIPLSWGGVIYTWYSWHTLVPLVLGVFGLCLFVCQQIYRGSARGGNKKTIIPMRMSKNRTTALTYLVTFLHGVILWSMVYYLPLYFEGAHLYDTLQAGLSALPQTLTVIPCAMVVGVIASKTGRYRWSLHAGTALTVLGTGILYLLDINTPVVEWIFLRLVSGIGVGFLYPSMNLSVQSSVLPDDVGVAAGLVNFFRALGQSCGVAMGGVIFQNRIESILSPFPQAKGASLDAVALVPAIKSLAPDSTEALILRHAFANSIKTIWATICGLAGIALIATLFMKEYKLDQVHAGEQGFIDPKKTGAGKEEGGQDIMMTERQEVQPSVETRNKSASNVGGDRKYSYDGSVGGSRSSTCGGRGSSDEEEQPLTQEDKEREEEEQKDTIMNQASRSDTSLGKSKSRSASATSLGKSKSR